MNLPEAKQCTDTDSHLFGTVAVKAGENRWGCMSPVNGGHWATDAEVADWTPLNA